LDFIYNNASLKKIRQELRRNQTEAEKALWRKLRNRQFYGFKFFRFWNNEVIQNMDGVLLKISEKVTPPDLPFRKGDEIFYDNRK